MQAKKDHCYIDFICKLTFLFFLFYHCCLSRVYSIETFNCEIHPSDFMWFKFPYFKISRIQLKVVHRFKKCKHPIYKKKNPIIQILSIMI